LTWASPATASINAAPPEAGPLEVPCLDGDGEVDERAGRSGDRKATVHATVSGIEVPRAVGPDAPGTTVAGDHGYVD